MEYLKAAIALRYLINETNIALLKKGKGVTANINRMYVKSKEGNTQVIDMEIYTNEFVNAIIDELGNPEAFVITDMACMDVNGKKLDYLLYKGYHSEIEKGMVFYQVIEKETLAPMGPLRFSNMEENIFYTVKEPQFEESSCNAIESKKVVGDGKGIVFLIGHMEEERLIYDIQRLIIDTVNNVEKHAKLKFNFVINISRFGGIPSHELKEQVKAIEDFTLENVCPEYPNATFQFTYEEDSSLNM